MAETITLDPAAVATSRTALDLTPFISVEGVDWGDAQITQYLADGMYGGDPVDYKVPNRQVTIPLKLMARGTATFEQSRRWVQAKAALFQREGGWLSRVTGAGTLYADVVNASLKLGGDWLQASKSADIDAMLSLELKPDWYGAEITLDDKTETTLPVLTTVLKLSAADAVIGGDYPNRVRVVVDEDDADSQLGLIWGFRSRYYDSAATAALFYQAEALTPMDAATVVNHTPASGGTAVTHASPGETWVPVLSTRIASGAQDLTHRGTYRVWARCYSLSSAPRVRFLWDVGDLTNPEENEPTNIPAAANYYWLDLGEIRLDPPAVGTHRWQGVIQAKRSADDAAVAGLTVDCIAFQPIDDGGGVLSASLNADPGLVTYTARDEFNQTAGGLNAKVLSVGGTWATSGGDADDFQVSGGGLGLVTRAVVSDSPLLHSEIGRLAVAGTATLTTCAIEATGMVSTLVSTNFGVVARRVDANNFLFAEVDWGTTTVAPFVIVRKVIASVVTIVGIGAVPATAVNVAYRLRVLVTTTGRLLVWFSRGTGSLGDPVFVTTDTDLATGGTLASGGYGFTDTNQFSTACTRTYDSFTAWVPTLDAVMFASQSAQLTTDGMFREDSAGVAYGPVSPKSGSLPRLPPSGLEGRKVELFLKGSRGDFDQVPDSGIDDISAQAFYRPSWLIAPGS